MFVLLLLLNFSFFAIIGRMGHWLSDNTFIDMTENMSDSAYQNQITNTVLARIKLIGEINLTDLEKRNAFRSTLTPSVSHTELLEMYRQMRRGHGNQVTRFCQVVQEEHPLAVSLAIRFLHLITEHGSISAADEHKDNIVTYCFAAAIMPWLRHKATRGDARHGNMDFQLVIYL